MASPSTPASKDNLRSSTREIIDHFNQSQDKQSTWIKEEFDKVHVELEAIKQLLVYRQELHNLVRELKAQGMTLNESKIFSA